MVFSSLPLYLDPPNWQHHPQQQGGSTSGNNENPQILPPPPGPAAPPPHIGMVVGGGGGVGMAPTTSIRPNSMAEKARLAKIPPPEAPLKCPRCDSTNTKFCYFNNYSLSQPRHFCKTCRRYWTRGGALRNVPVGGGCRRNKRSKSRSTAATTAKSTLDGQSPTTTGGATCTTSPMMISDIHHLPQTNTPISLMAASLQNLTHLGISNFNPIDYSSTNNNPNFLSGLENWRMNPTQNFPNFLAGFEIPSSSSVAANSGLYPFQNEEAIDNNSSKNELGLGSYGGIVSPGEIIRSKISSGLISQLGQVKMEEGQFNFQKQLMGMSGNNGNSNNNNNNNNDNNNSNISNSNQFWGTGGGTISTNTSSMWSDISGLNSSSHAHQHFL